MAPMRGGHPTDDSDLDLLVVVESSGKKRYKRSVAGLSALFGLNISKDLIVCTRDEFTRNAADKTSLYFKIKHDGKRIVIGFDSTRRVLVDFPSVFSC